MIIEACVENASEAMLAEKNGAHRLELCSHLEVDGLTPAIDVVKEVLDKVSIPVKVMIRPRQSHFRYTQRELIKMSASVCTMKDLGVYGVVFGALNYQNTVDFENTASLAELAKPLNVTFHKAIDFTLDPVESAKVIAGIKSVDAILTSGGRLTAADGMKHINHMIEATEGHLEIIAAGKVTSKNLSELQNKIKTRSFHGRSIVPLN